MAAATGNQVDSEQQLALALMNGGREGLKNLLVYQICTKAVPFVLKGFFGAINNALKRRVEHHVKQINNMSSKQKASSIILSRDYEKDLASNILFDAVLSFVSELPQTKHVKRTTTGVFMMATKDEIEISQNILVKKLSETVADDKVVKMFIEMYSYTYDLTTLRKYLDDLEEKYKMSLANQLGKNIFYFDELPITLPIGFDKKPDLSKAPQRLVFSKYVLHTNKSLKNIYGDSVKIVRKRVDFFMNNKRWYEEKGVPYTLGLLLHGVPGAGKTSCIKSIAKDTNRHILNIRLSQNTTVSQLNNLFYSPQVSVVNNGQTKVYDIPIDKRILVLEDVDCLSDVVLERKHAVDEAKESSGTETKDTTNRYEQMMTPSQQTSPCTNEVLNLSTLLNILDGVLEQPGRIIIMTSNHPEKLDKALIRPGRIDVIVNFSYCKKHEIAEIVNAFTNHQMTAEELEKVVENQWTPAEVTQIIFENFEDIPSLIAALGIKKSMSSDEVVESPQNVGVQNLENIIVETKVIDNLAFDKQSETEEEQAEQEAVHETEIKPITTLKKEKYTGPLATVETVDKIHKYDASKLDAHNPQSKEFPSLLSSDLNNCSLSNDGGSLDEYFSVMTTM